MSKAKVEAEAAMKTEETEMRETFEKWARRSATRLDLSHYICPEVGINEERTYELIETELEWLKWQAAYAAGRAAEEGWASDAAIERLARFIVQKESINCKTLDQALHHQSTWRRVIPEAKEMLKAAFPAPPAAGEKP